MNSKNNTQTCLPPPSTDLACSSTAAEESTAATAPVLRVLLLEDNVELAELLRLIFETWGFQPTVAHLGQEASRLLDNKNSVWLWWTSICQTRRDSRLFLVRWRKACCRTPKSSFFPAPLARSESQWPNSFPAVSSSPSRLKCKIYCR